MRQIVAARNKKVDILKDKTLEIQRKEFEEAHHKHTSVYAPQSFQNKGDSDSEEPGVGTEEDPEEGPEEDPEEELEEDLEPGLEETTNEQTQGELIKGSKFEPEDDKEENSGQRANSGKQRRSSWDQDPENDQNTVAEDGKRKKRKTRWDADVSKSGSLLDCEVLVKRNAIFCKELYIPVKEYPTYNFIGLILGPKGNTHKRMEMKSGAKIRLRGKGSSKLAQEGDPSNEKGLHVRIEAVSQKSLDAAVSMVEKLLIPVEEGMNDHKRAQLQELSSLKAAAINNSCSVCKETGHNHFACPRKSI